MASRGVWTGLNQATGNVMNTALNFMQLQANARHQRALESESTQRLALEGQRFNLEKDRGVREAKAFEYVEAERQTKERQKKAFVPTSVVAPQLHQLPETLKLYIQSLEEAGYEVKKTPDGEVYFTNEGIAYLKELTNTKLAFGKAKIDSVFTDLQNQSLTLGQQIAQLQESGKTDEKTLAPLQQKQAAIKTQIADIMGAQRDVMEKILEEQAKVKTGQDLQRKTKTFEKKGQLWAQDYNFNPKTGDETLVGNPYQQRPERESANIYIGTTPEGGVVVGNTRGEPSVKVIKGTGTPILPKNQPVMPSEQVSGLQQIQTLKDALKTASDSYDPNYVGPAAGRISAAQESVLGGAGFSEKRAIFYSALEQLRNSLVYLLSGKQINENEFKRLEKQLPGRNLAPTVFNARMKEFKRTLDSILKGREKLLRQSGYGVNAPDPLGIR